MFNRDRLQEILINYKEDYLSHWNNEKYKWVAVKHFQEIWNINADDFPEMLAKALEKMSNLLTSVNRFPARMIYVFAKMEPETVRGMFIDLFDENKDYYARIKSFKEKSDQLLTEWEEKVRCKRGEIR